MAAHLQDLAEELAARLDRSVAIDDARLNLLAHSSHRGTVDRARAESIIRRTVPRELVDHVRACRDARTGLYIVEPRADLGLDDRRIGYPILHRGSLLGFVWLLGSESGSDGEQRDVVERAADAAAVLMQREHLRAGSLRDREHELADLLLGDDDAARRDAAAALHDEGIFSSSSYSVLVAELDRAGGHPTEQDRLALASGLAAVRARHLPHEVVALERGDSAVVIAADPRGGDARERQIELGEDLRARVRAESPDAECRVGISRSRPDLADAARGLDEATRAARVIRRVGAPDAVIAVEALGVYELLDQLPDDALRAAIPPGLLALAEQRGRNDSLMRTLEVFLDSAGDVRSASEQLFAHRTSLYYRLRRIEEISGLDLSDGDARLVAHVGLRIIRLLDDRTDARTDPAPSKRS